MIPSFFSLKQDIVYCAPEGKFRLKYIYEVPLLTTPCNFRYLECQVNQTVETRVEAL